MPCPPPGVRRRGRIQDTRTWAGAHARTHKREPVPRDRSRGGSGPRAGASPRPRQEGRDGRTDGRPHRSPPRTAETPADTSPGPARRRGRGPPREAARAFRGPTPGTGTRLTPPARSASTSRARFESVRELVERLLDRGLVGERRRCPAADPLQPAGTELVTGEEPVHIRALDPAVGGHRTVRASLQVREGPGRVGTRGRAHVDLVSGDRRGASRAGPGHRDAPTSHPASPSPRRAGRGRALRRRTVAPVRIAHPPAEHLIPAAQPEHPAAGARVGDDVVVPSLRPQKLEITEGRLRSRQDDDVGVTRQGGSRRGRRRNPPPAPA